MNDLLQHLDNDKLCLYVARSFQGRAARWARVGVRLFDLSDSESLRGDRERAGRLAIVGNKVANLVDRLTQNRARQ